MNNSLLALLLTLPDREPLTPEEQKSLKKVAVQLDTDPKAWESHIEPDLIKIIQAKPTWHQQFTAKKAQLDDLGDNILDLLPFPDESSSDRGRPKGDPNDSTYSPLIKNFSVSILEHSDPQSASQKCQEAGFFNKLKEKLGG